MAIREGRWKCPRCEVINRGRDMECSGCGAARGKDIEFLLEEDAQEVTDAAQLERAALGADWHCAYCDTDNQADEDRCSQCGANKLEGKNRKQFLVTSGGDSKPAAPAPAPHKASKGRSTPVKRGGGKLIAFLAVAAVLAGAAFFFGVFSTKEAEVVLTGGEWSRTIPVEAREWVRRQAWQDEVPAEARIVRSWEEQRGTRKVEVGKERVKVGTKDLGNGYFEDVFEERPVFREDPVHDTKVEYERLEWRQIRTHDSTGSMADEPAWPQVMLSSGEREGKRSESASLSFKGADKDTEGMIFTLSVRPDQLREYTAGRTYKAKVNRMTKKVSALLE